MGYKKGSAVAFLKNAVTTPQSGKLTNKVDPYLNRFY